MVVHWDDAGLEPPVGQAKLTAGEQVYAEDINWVLWELINDATDLRNEVANVYGANTILKSDTANHPIALEVIEQRVIGRKSGGSIDALPIGIANDDIVQIDGTVNVPVDNDYAKFTANGLEGRSYAELLVDVGVESGATADQTNEEIRDAVEAATDSNTFNDADHTKLNGVAAGADVTADNAPQAHAASHQSGGGDAIELDTLATPTDNVNLNSSITYHGLCPKLSNNSGQYLTGIGTWATPAGAGDMVKSTYDPNADGIIAVAQTEANNYSHPSAPPCRASTSSQTGHATAAQIAKLGGVAAGADITADNAPQAHKDSHDPQDGSDKLDTAIALEIASVQAGGIGSSHSFARADHVHAINHGIANNHLVTIDGTCVDNDYAKFTANGLEGRSYAELLVDVGVESGATADQTNTEIRDAVEAATNSNTFKDADHTKLNGVAAGADVTADNAPQAHGAAQHTDRTRSFFVKPSNQYTGTVSSRGVDLASAGNQYVYFNFKFPSDFVSASSLHVISYSAGASGDVVLDLQLYAMSVGENVYSHMPNDLDNVVPIVLTTANSWAADHTTLFANLTADDYINLQVLRDTDHANDTLGHTLSVIGLLVTYEADM